MSRREIAAREDSLAQRPRKIPPRALLLSLGILAVPVVGAAYAPELLREDTGLLLWLTPILPAFLLAYYRGWRGVTGVLALGMASITAANLVFVLSDVSPPPWPTMLILVVVYLVITNGVGALAELLHRERRAAEQAALIDPLTGLANRRHGEMHMDRAFAAAVRGAALAVVMFDLDRFKRVNDDFGHAIGDDVIRAMGEVLERNTRGMDLSARFGGEEFLVVLSDINAEEAMAFAGRVRENLRMLELPCGTVTVSAGVAVYEQGMGSAEVLIAAADRALYQAKRSGRDRAVLATIGPPAKVRLGPEHIKADSPGPATVLVVDDDIHVLAPLTRLVEAMGYRVTSAQGGREALATFEKEGEEPDVLLTDVMMPDMNGLVLVDELTRLGHHLPVIYMSGQIRARVTWPGISGDVAEFLQKPVDAEDLATSLRRILDPECEPELMAQPVGDAGQAKPTDTSPAPEIALESGPSLAPGIGMYPGGPSTSSSVEGLRRRKGPLRVNEIEEKIARRAISLRRKTRRRRVVGTVVVGLVLAGGIGLTVGFAAHRSAEELAKELAREQSAETVLSQGIDRTLRELWKMEDVEQARNQSR